jgi:uncharacterized protein with von Willebrand factor type A (vWA) domain
MMKLQAFATKNITESIVGFAQFLRGHGLNAGIEETKTALAAAEAGLLLDRIQFKYALKTIFCTSPEEGGLFEGLFPLYWDTNPIDLDPKDRKNKTGLAGIVKRGASAMMMGNGKTEECTREAKTVTGANETERLQQTDFSHVGEMDAENLQRIAEKLFREMAARLRRRRKNAGRHGDIDLRRTIRHSIPFGGEPMELYRKARKEKRQRLIILMDVSGSMDKYSFYLLRFVCALQGMFRQLEVFVFSTSLLRISRALRQNYLDRALQAIGEQADNWSGGTRIGECLREFSEKFGQRMLNGSPTIVVLSDGLDTGDPEVLAATMRRLRRRSGRIIWLNPLKGMRNYAPLAGGMQAALPSIDDFRSAHNLASLLELEKILANV